MSKKHPIALVLTDSHLHKDNIADVEDIWEQAITICKQHNINRIFHGGDLVTARQAQPLSVLESILRTRERLAEEKIITDLIEGNHDKTYLEAESGYSSIFATDMFRVHGSSYTIQMSKKVSISMLPYFPEMGTYTERLMTLIDSLDKSNYNILITHIGINGGLAHESVSTNKEIPAECFAGVDKVLVGHYHNRCQVEAENEIWFVGSTHPQNFGEDNEKGFTLIYSDGSHEYIKARFTEYRTITVDAEQVNTKFIKDLKKDITSSKDKVRLQIVGDESKLKTIDKAALTEAGVSKLKLKDSSVKLEGKQQEESFVSFTKQEILKEYKAFSLSSEIDPSLGLEYLQDIKG
jgi:exonuclease SbcD